ncbi:MAG: terminase small subunit, partial [Rhodospirillaceae bacterium]|nr:terminase small subunit [Rhodospirillaceae bacterium]MBT7569945.1 terminase small subunit [Rhodospirillaceae bacterium]
MTLNSRQETFCHAYASGANGTQAARQAGYGTAGAANQASRLLQNPDV